MKRFAAAALAGLLFSAPSFAEYKYQPKGESRPLDAIVDEVLAGASPSFVFDHGAAFVELNEGGGQGARYAEAPDVETLEQALRTREKSRVVKVGNTNWTLSWNKAQSEYGDVAYDTFGQLKAAATDSKELDHAENEEDSFRSVASVFDESFEPMTITPGFISFYNVTAGYTGGAAHDYAGVSFGTKKAISNEPVSLVELVDNQSLLDALKKDSFLLKAAKAAGKLREFTRATQLTDLAQICADMTFASGLNVAWSVTAMEQFQKFAIWDYDVKTGEALVRIGLEYNSEVNRGQFEQLGLRVKAKPEFAKELAAMKKSGQGLLMKDVAKGKRP